MTDAAEAERHRAVSFVRLCEAASHLGVAFDAAKAVESGIAISDLLLIIWSDIAAELADGTPSFEVIEAIEKAARAH